MIRQGLKLFCVLAVSLLLISCDQANKAYMDANKTVSGTQKKIDQARKNSDASPVVIEKAGYYVDDNPESIVKNPTWLKQKINFQGQNLP